MPASEGSKRIAPGTEARAAFALGKADTGRTDPPVLVGATGPADTGRADPEKLAGPADTGRADPPVLLGAIGPPGTEARAAFAPGTAETGRADPKLLGPVGRASAGEAVVAADGGAQSAPGAGGGGSSYPPSTESGALPDGVRAASGLSPAPSGVACRLSIWVLPTADIPRRRVVAGRRVLTLTVPYARASAHPAWAQRPPESQARVQIRK